MQAQKPIPFLLHGPCGLYLHCISFKFCLGTLFTRQETTTEMSVAFQAYTLLIVGFVLQSVSVQS